MNPRNEDAREPDLAVLRSMVAMTPPEDAIFAVAADRSILFWSERMEAVFGITSAEATGKPLEALLPFLVTSGDIDSVARALAGERVATKRRPFRVPDVEREGWYDAWYAPLASASGAIGIVNDVTEKVRTEQRLRETENRFRNMADAAPVLLWMSGTDSMCTFFNKSWLSFTGRRIEDELGVGWSEGVHAEDFQRCMDTYLAAFNAREEFETEYRLRRADGAYRVILDRGVPRYEPDGGFAGYIGSCVDITEHKELEAHLRKALRDRDDFLSIASHELKTPLTTLQLAVEILERTAKKADPEIAARFSRYVSKVESQASRLAMLIDDLLDVSRLTGGRFELVPEDVDLSHLVRDVLSRLHDSIRTSGCPLTVEVVDGIRGRWDRGRLERVLTNLVMNALKYAASKPIFVSARTEEGSAIFTVRDEGMGISEEDQVRIFDRFERGVSARNYGGFGLGLWIAKQIVEAHGGRVQVRSKLGDGATFVVSLPMPP